ncbi:LptA/OstA family protein [Brevundimonas sp. UBA7534]|uniref:LptA/OstA family protein n=1 Tax=Brevundimonas sp. UBA7534 TaxID=1946138 RepID=UPI0025BFC630|nr:LptA/OstA family protein [Brevundimonas sp. UBA7534]
MKLSKSKLTIAGAALLTALMLPAVSGAQNAAAGRGDASRQPVQYGADSGEYTPDGFSLRGRAEVTQGGNRLRADAIRGFTSNGDLNRIEATGGVYFVTPDQSMKGDRAVYTLNDGNVVVTGDVILTQGKSVLTGSRLVYNVRTETARIEGAIASGTYDAGLETLRAESFVVTDRQTIYTHPRTGAQTRLLTITERKRNHPVTLAEAIGNLDDPRAVLLVNERSGRAAVQVPTTSVMLDDGEIERRVRLIRPIEAHNIPVKTMPETHWVEADRDAFASAWNAEIAEVPEFSDSTLHMVTGLLLPIWKRLPNESTRVYRLQTDAGERIIGRRVSPAWVAHATATGVASWSMNWSMRRTAWRRSCPASSATMASTSIWGPTPSPTPTASSWTARKSASATIFRPGLASSS